MAYPQPTQGYQPGPPSYTPYAGQAQPGYAPQPPPQQYGYQPQPAGYGGQQQSANTNVVVVQQQAAPRVSELIDCSLIFKKKSVIGVLKTNSWVALHIVYSASPRLRLPRVMR